MKDAARKMLQKNATEQIPEKNASTKPKTKSLKKEK